MTSQEFARAFEDARRVLWCAAVGVVGDRTLAQDVVQSAAVVGLQKSGEFQRGTSFVAWMVQIVRHIGMNESRKRTRRRTTSVESEVLDGHPSSLTHAQGHPLALAGRGAVTSRGGLAADQGAFDDDLVWALESLEEPARACLLMRCVLEMPYRDIGLALGMPEGTAASHVHRARKCVRKALASRGHSSAVVVSPAGRAARSDGRASERTVA